jgi:hypothetical protein
VVFLIILTKSVLKERFLFYQNNFQGGWVLQVDPRIYQENQVVYKKFIVTQRTNRQLKAGSATALICGLGQIYLCKTKPKYILQIRLKRDSKRSTTLAAWRSQVFIGINRV